MGSRQRPSGHTTSDTGGEQARGGRGPEGDRAAAAEQRRHEEEMLADAREDVEETLPGDEPAAEAPPEPDVQGAGEPERDTSGQPRTAPPGTAVSGFPEPPGPGSTDTSAPPHQALNNPVGDPDPTEWPDPYERREDPRDPPDPDGLPFGEEPHAPTGSTSTSEPHPSQDPEATKSTPPEKDRLND